MGFGTSIFKRLAVRLSISLLVATVLFSNGCASETQDPIDECTCFAADQCCDGCMPINSGSSCDDGVYCNGGEICALGACTPGNPITCSDDGNVCTNDLSCDLELGCNWPTDACSDDGNACTNDLSCDPQLGCNWPDDTLNCADGLACNGIETCSDGTCLPDSCAGTGCLCAALYFGGTGARVTMGTAAELNTAAFTLEAWVRWDGGGLTANTGTGGINGYPIIAKGRGEADGDTRDLNYFFGLSTQGQLVADMEEHTMGDNPGLNHPVTGATSLDIGVWTHVAATYDGTCWELYRNGVADTDGSNCPGQPPNYESIQEFAVATSFNSQGAAQGAFHGAIDEVRVWDHARTGAQISTNASQEIDSSSGLLGRWGFNEASGLIAGDDAGASQNDGTLVGATWTEGAPFAWVRPLGPPVLVAPNDGGIAISDLLEVAVSDQEGMDVTVEFLGRTLSSGLLADWTLIALPDTQYYTDGSGLSSIFAAQTQWIVDSTPSMNIAYTAQLGDCVQNGDKGGDDSEWLIADAAMGVLEAPIAGLPDGMPYGICVGNHDQSPFGLPGSLADQSSTTTSYNQFFGTARFSGRSYYGGYFGTNNDNHYDVFSAGGADYIAIYFEFDETPSSALHQAVLDWADALLKSHSDRHGIILSHYLLELGEQNDFSSQGAEIYRRLRSNPNLFMMLAGHRPGEGKRVDFHNGRRVDTLLADYQNRANGGDGWLRSMTFSPSTRQVQVKTYSPTLVLSETDADSEFTLPFIGDGTPFASLGTTTVPSGSTAQISWPGSTGSSHEWYVVIEAGGRRVVGPVWAFTRQ